MSPISDRPKDKPLKHQNLAGNKNGNILRPKINTFRAMGRLRAGFYDLPGPLDIALDRMIAAEAGSVTDE